MAPDADTVVIPPISLIVGKKLQGSAMGSAKRGNIPQLIDWMMDGKINLASLITARMPLEEINDGYDMMRRGEGIRSVVTFP